MTHKPKINKKILLHLSHTDIRSDPRILKEMDALANALNCKVVGIGFELDEAEAPAISDLSSRFYILTKILKTRKWSLLPRSFRYVLNFIELTLKLLVPAIRLNPSVVHCHDTLALPAGWIIKIILGCSLVYDAHELESNKNGQTKILSKGTLIIEKIIWPKVDLLISVSNLILEWYKTNLGYKPAILVLNSPVFHEGVVNSKKTEINRVYFQKKFKLDNDAIIFVYLGILGPGRGIDICLNAFESGPKNAHVVFIGYGAYENKIKDYSHRCSNIHFHHAVHHDQVVSLVSNANFGLCLIENVSLSDYYCLPNKLFEYIFANIPVLASRFPEISSIVDKYSLGICCDLDEDSVQEALHKIVRTKPKFGHLEITDLSWDIQAGRLIDSYRILLESN